MFKYLLILAFILRIFSINQSLWLDEATSAIVARDLNPSEILYYFSRTDFHPPLYYLFLDIWTTLFGTGEFILRLPSVLFGVATVAFTYKIAQLFSKKTLPMLSGILMATAPLHIYYSQEARMYSLATLLISITVYLLLQAKKGSKLILFGSGCFFALAFLTEYMTVFMFPVLLYIVVRYKKFNLSRIFMFVFPFILAIVAVFPLFTYQFSAALHVKEMGSLWWNTLGTFSLKSILLVPVKFLIGRIGFDSNLVYAFYAGGSFLLFSFLIFKGLTKNTQKYMPLLVWLTFPALMAIGTSTFLPVLYYFRLIFSLPALYILTGLGLMNIKEKYFVPAFVGVLAFNMVSAAIYFSNVTFHREDWRGMVSYINSVAGNNSVVFVANSQFEAVKYYDKNLKIATIDNVDVGSDKIWLMRYVQDVFDPKDNVRQKLEGLNFEKVNEHNFNGVVVWEYENRN